MNLLKKAAAALLAVCTACTCVSCGENTANAMNVAGKDVRAGIYLYYVTSAYNDAIDVLADGGEKFDDAKTSKDVKKILDKANINNITAEEWIQNKAEEYCAGFVAIEQEFERLGLTLSGADKAGIDSQTETNMAIYGSYYEATGIGEQSVRDIVANSYKQKAVWNAYYGKDGIKEIDEQELYDFYKDNHFRLKYIEMPLKDGEGNLLKSDGKAEIEKMAQDYLARLAKKAGDEAALMKEFDFLSDEHKTYVTSLSQAAVTTTDDEGNTITTPTTAKVTTDENGNTAATTDATAETKDEDTAETTDVTTEATVETTTTETTTAADVTDNTVDVTTGTTDTTTTTTTTATGYDYSYERLIVRSTSASKADEEADTTTTEPTYTPCEKVYNWLIDDDTDYLKPELIKDDECWYIAVKMNIEDRMTANDYWNETNVENTRSDLYYDEYLEMLKDISDKLEVKRNQKAFKRYKVLDIDILLYQQLLMQYYYSMYGIS